MEKFMPPKRTKADVYSGHNSDEMLVRETIINELPAGLGQVAQALPEPMVIHDFKTIEIKEPAVLGAEDPLLDVIMPRRKCKNKKCDDILPPERFMFCKGCKSKLDEDPGDKLYCGVSGEE